MKALTLILCLAGAAIAVLQPLVAFGDGRWGPGFGDLLNGGVGLGLLLLGGLSAVILLRRQRLAGGAK